MNFCSREIAAKSSTASLFTSVEMVNFWNAVCKMSSLNDLPVAALISSLIIFAAPSAF